MDDAGVDFAFVAWREDDGWHLLPAPSDAADDLDRLVAFARRHQGHTGCLAFVSVGEEFFICLRIQGALVRILLSDVAAALDWPLAEQAAELLGLDIDALDDVEEMDSLEPAGDLTLLADHGLSAADLDLLCADPELYPDEQIGSIAARAGFGGELTSLLDVAPA